MTDLYETIQWRYVGSQPKDDAALLKEIAAKLADHLGRFDPLFLAGNPK